MAHVSFNRFDEVGNEVVATLELHIDLRPRVVHIVAQVDEAVVSHEAGTAIVTLNAEVDDEVLKKAVEAQDYPVTSIQ